MIEVFLRKTNGKGERVLLNPDLTVKGFCSEAKSLFGDQGLEIYFLGSKIAQQSDERMDSLGVIKGSIFHIETEDKDEKSSLVSIDNFEVKVFFQRTIHRILTNNSSSTTFAEIFEIISPKINYHSQSEQVSVPKFFHLGREVTLEDKISSHRIKSGDVLTLILVPQRNTKIISFLEQKCKTTQTVKGESVTLATSEQRAEMKKNNSVFQSKELLRKSSMKSSHQSREFDRNFQRQSNMKTSRSKSEGKQKENPQAPDSDFDAQTNMNSELKKQSKKQEILEKKEEQIEENNTVQIQNEENKEDFMKQRPSISVMRPKEQSNLIEENIRTEEVSGQEQQEEGTDSFEGLDLLKHCWLTNKKFIETESINCDQEDPNSPSLWIDYETVYYVFDCMDKQTLQNVIQKLQRIEKSSFTFSCPSNEKISQLLSKPEEWTTIEVLELAKDLELQELPCITFC